MSEIIWREIATPEDLKARRRLIDAFQRLELGWPKERFRPGGDLWGRFRRAWSSRVDGSRYDELHWHAAERTLLGFTEPRTLNDGFFAGVSAEDAEAILSVIEGFADLPPVGEAGRRRGGLTAMTDDEIMSRLWATPDCPVKLTAPDSEYPWKPEVPWPRERVDVPSDAGTSWRLRCSCRNANVRALDDVDDPPVPLRPPVVELSAFRWAFCPINAKASDPAVDVRVRVYLGQCGDCGRIYWGLVREV